MASTIDKYKIYRDICDALGLEVKGLYSFELCIVANEQITIKTKRYVHKEELKKFVPILQEYYLTKKEEPEQEFAWLAEYLDGSIPWYAISDENALDDTVRPNLTNDAYNAKRFNTEEECANWIESWKLREDRTRFRPIQHGFIKALAAQEERRMNKDKLKKIDTLTDEIKKLISPYCLNYIQKNYGAGWWGYTLNANPDELDDIYLSNIRVKLEWIRSTLEKVNLV